MTAEALVRWMEAKVWRIERAIRDERAEERYTFVGGARIIRDREVWRYEEVGELRGRGVECSARRGYIYAPQQDCLSVSFEDQRPFFTIACDQLPNATFEHRCEADVYSGRMILGRDHWTLDWTVTGPNKLLSIRTRYF